jgi:hypothetical protein
MIAKLAAGVFAGMLPGAAVGAVFPATAYADPEVPSGQYEHTSQDGKKEVWTFTPCGPDCTVAKGPIRSWEFHLTNGGWSSANPEEGTCDDGTKIALNEVLSFDPVSLTGQSISTAPAGGCGAPPGSEFSGSFLLAKVG